MALAAKHLRADIVHQNCETIADLGSRTKLHEPKTCIHVASGNTNQPHGYRHSPLSDEHKPFVALHSAANITPGIVKLTTCSTGALSPPLIVTEAQIGEIFDKVARIIKTVA